MNTKMIMTKLMKPMAILAAYWRFSMSTDW
jgi:hypothetical protein